ncbi:MAG: glycosyltransferase family 2 protein [Oscillospiraceae bacterium]|nr:glycosyltransferase family 2 protein [Oscillospiraceae bacterium]
MNKPLLTVFTPAYNRAYTLPRTYDSLCRQENKNFIWLVVDDGSSDNTAELVEKWQGEACGFEIRYIYKENGGMHTAHNTAYANIDTELNVCIDSDDALAPNAVQIICDAWEKVRDKGYAGLLGLDAEFDGTVIGKGFPKELKETTLGDYYRNGGFGDKKLVLRTDVVREYPQYPVFEGEKFVPLGSLYTMIDRDYKLCVVDEVICLVEYMPDGSTKNMLRQYLKNPKGFRYSRLVTLQDRTTLKRRCVLYVHFAAESILAGESMLKDAPSKLMAVAAAPFGAALALYIKFKCR